MIPWASPRRNEVKFGQLVLYPEDFVIVVITITNNNSIPVEYRFPSIKLESEAWYNHHTICEGSLLPWRETPAHESNEFRRTLQIPSGEDAHPADECRVYFEMDRRNTAHDLSAEWYEEELGMFSISTISELSDPGVEIELLSG